ncbi:MAG: hypothetical protein GY944_02200 [bacterium]|nr:hypothetical protein [bacterium]
MLNIATRMYVLIACCLPVTCLPLAAQEALSFELEATPLRHEHGHFSRMSTRQTPLDLIPADAPAEWNSVNAFSLPLPDADLLLCITGRLPEADGFCARVDEDGDGKLDDERTLTIAEAGLRVPVLAGARRTTIELSVRNGQLSYQVLDLWRARCRLGKDTLKIAMIWMTHDYAMMIRDLDGDGEYETYVVGGNPIELDGRFFELKPEVSKHRLQLVPTERRPVLPGYPAPAQSLRVYGEDATFEVGGASDRMTALVFIHPGCVGCNQIISDVNRWNQEHSDELRIGFVVTEESLAKTFRERLKLEPTLLISKSAWKEFHVQPVRTAVLIDRTGLIRFRGHWGEPKCQALLATLVKAP